MSRLRSRIDVTTTTSASSGIFDVDESVRYDTEDPRLAEPGRPATPPIIETRPPP